ncbi:uncharacterized protein [Clytia hemisphaerica]|uniref:Uncharacterized protein n=1 Tax=Clytia hemisphaerica TaxID=252671 RepID=A0A7M5X2U4_9CNID
MAKMASKIVLSVVMVCLTMEFVVARNENLCDYNLFQDNQAVTAEINGEYDGETTMLLNYCSGSFRSCGEVSHFGQRNRCCTFAKNFCNQQPACGDYCACWREKCRGK